MIEIKEIHSEKDFNGDFTREQFIDFLYEHLDKFGDPKDAINNCLSYAFSDEPGKGGFALAAFEDGKLLGALIHNKIRTEGYIPTNILVYVAVHRDARGKGLGRKLCEKCIEMCDGDVKLHVEYDNPAKRLYERIGFTNKYAEMRFTK
ncbi:MAG: GNAT family N-acetyltransferase [Candidatus Kapaibacterium sp.]